MNIGFDFNKGEFITTPDKEVNKVESTILEQIIPNIDVKFPQALKIVANSSAYTTLQYKQIDIIRLKYTNNTQWIKIRCSNRMLKEEQDNPLFNEQEKKNESMWKCRVDDLEQLYPYINEGIKELFKEQ